jgi:hypothetical protein
MKRQLLPSILIIAAVALACTAYLTKEPLYRVTIAPPVHDFGKVRPEVVKCTFSLTNTFPYDIQLLSVVKSCGCTTADIQAAILKPQEAATLNCAFDLKGRSGEFSTKVSVLFRRKSQLKEPVQSVDCTATALVDPWTWTEPGDLQFKAGTSSTATLKMKSINPKVRFVSASVDHQAFSLLSDQTNGQVTVSFDARQWRDREGFAHIDMVIEGEDPSRLSIPISVMKQ